MAPADGGAKPRFTPSLSPLKDMILMCDFYTDIMDDREVDKEMASVPLHFTSEQHYRDVFLPLYFEELKMQLLRCQQTEMNPKNELVEFQNFQFQDGLIKLELQRRFESAKTVFMGNNDLVLLSQCENPKEPCAVHALGFVEGSWDTTVTVSVKIDLNETEVGSRAHGVAQKITQRGSWYLGKICSLVTNIREYEALVSLPHIALRDLILNADDSAALPQGTETQAAALAPGLNEDGGAGTCEDGSNGLIVPVQEDASSLSVPDPVEKWIQARYNDSQRTAIGDSRKLAGITLVQGPPGTGKTTTIIGILSMLLCSSAQSTKIVSYTRTNRTRVPGVEKEDSDNSSSSESEPDGVMQARQQERLRLIRTRTQWMKSAYIPWADTVEQELSTGNNMVRKSPYPKLVQKDMVHMSETVEDAAPQHILVCAPSNAAIDEVIRRTLRDTLVDKSGASFKPSLVRLGPNVHQSLENYSFEKVVKRRLAARNDGAGAIARDTEKLRVLRDAQLVCSTLSVSGSRELVTFPNDFDTVVIDEASQAVELSLLVALKLGCRRLILVGDPEQLPATVFSKVASDHDFDQSLFQRLQFSGHRVNMLQEQYRMHPAISKFPSDRFYDGKLLNALDEKQFEEVFPAPWCVAPCFSPVVFFHLKSSHSKSMQSLVNETEADFVLQLFRTFTDLHPSRSEWAPKIGVITPYAEQVGLLRKKFRELFCVGPKAPCPVDVNTVDGFQGREKDIIIMSVVRASSGNSKSIGFVRDRRRMNVAFTRARFSLWVVGHAEVLSVNEDWSAFIQLQKQNCRFMRVPSEPATATFLRKYLDDWYERHPEIARPSTFLKAPETAATESAVDVEIRDEVSDIEVADPGDHVLRDVEEVSDGLGEALSDVENEDGSAQPLIREAVQGDLEKNNASVGDDPT